MTSERTQTAYAVAIAASGMFFILGGFVMASGFGERLLLLIVLGGALIGGAYAMRLLHRSTRLSKENETLLASNSNIAEREADMKTQMRYTLRDPLASIVGDADRLMGSPTMPYDEQRALLAGIRDNAREVEQALGDLAGAASTDPAHAPQISSVVLLDNELLSIGESSDSADHFDFEISPARAWGDPAKVRQILRTLINISTHDEGERLTLQTAQRGPSATATVSGKGAILPTTAHAAMSERDQPTASNDGFYEAMRAAVNLARSMGGSISHVHAFGVSHVLLTLPAPEGGTSRAQHGDEEIKGTHRVDIPGDADSHFDTAPLIASS